MVDENKPFPTVAQEQAAAKVPLEETAEYKEDLQRHRVFMAQEQAKKVAGITAELGIPAPTSAANLFAPLTVSPDQSNIPVPDDFETINIRGKLNGPVKHVIVMGPPKVPFSLSRKHIFKGRDLNADLEMDMQVALMYSYVRSINGRPTPDPITNFSQVIEMATAVGDLGDRAIRECWGQDWPSGGGIFWDYVKKNAETPSS